MVKATDFVIERPRVRVSPLRCRVQSWTGHLPTWFILANCRGEIVSFFWRDPNRMMLAWNNNTILLAKWQKTLAQSVQSKQFPHHSSENVAKTNLCNIFCHSRSTVIYITFWQNFDKLYRLQMIKKITFTFKVEFIQQLQTHSSYRPEIAQVINVSFVNMSSWRT